MVELSIVLVILGLLVGGILSGQALIRASELRAVPAEYNRYIAATQTFRDKYFALPGDMANAIAFWGTDPGGCPSGAGSTGTCNGNGNGLIGNTLSQSCEMQEFWRQLSRAGLIEGTYTTIAATSCYAAPTPGTNLPRSRMANTAITIAHAGDIISSGAWPGNGFYTASYGHVLLFGLNNGVNHLSVRSSFSTEDSWNIDTKMDDGSPDSGTVYSLRLGVYNANCVTDATPGSADYNLTATGLQCAIIIKTGF